MSAQSTRPSRNVLPDLIIPGLALAFTVYYLTTIIDVPWTSQASAVTVSGFLLLSIAAFAVRTAYRVRHGREHIGLDFGRFDPVLTGRRVVLLLLSIGYIAAIDRLGFTLTTTVFVFTGVVLLSSLANWRAALAVALGCSIFGYLVFIYFFKTRFPRGPVEELLNGLL